MLLLMNSAMMPTDGLYRRETLTETEARTLFFSYQNDYKSFLGYENSCRVFKELTGVKVEMNREKTRVRDNDIMLAMQLSYRVNPAEKGDRRHGDKLSDYVFSRISYKE